MRWTTTQDKQSTVWFLISRSRAIDAHCLLGVLKSSSAQKSFNCLHQFPTQFLRSQCDWWSASSVPRVLLSINNDFLLVSDTLLNDTLDDTVKWCTSWVCLIKQLSYGWRGPQVLGKWIYGLTMINNTRNIKWRWKCIFFLQPKLYYRENSNTKNNGKAWSRMPCTSNMYLNRLKFDNMLQMFPS